MESISIEPARAEQADADGTAEAPVAPRRPGLPSAWPGVLAVVLAVACAGLVAAGVAVALAGDFAVSTLLAQLAIGCSIAAIVTGVVAIVLKSGRRWGIAGCVLGFLANPLVTVVVLRTFDGI